jgi:hypothetical protein
MLSAVSINQPEESREPKKLKSPHQLLVIGKKLIILSIPWKAVKE